MSDSNYYAAINTKLAKRNSVVSEKSNLKNMENKITNNLINHYDQNFDNKYDNNVSLNTDIQNKDRIIQINNSSYFNKTNIIFALKYLLSLLLLIFLLIIGSGFNIYSTQTMYTIFLLSFIGYVVIIYYKIAFDKHTSGEYYAGKFLKEETGNAIKSLARNILPHYMTKNRCPKGCRHKIPKCPKNDLECQYKNTNIIKDMYTDSTLNEWEYGDILLNNCTVVDATDKQKQNNPNIGNRLLKCPLRDPITDSEGQEIDHILINRPEPWYGSTNNTTKHTCEWNGPDTGSSGGPIGDQGIKFTSSIPCKYFPGYKDISE